MNFDMDDDCEENNTHEGDFLTIGRKVRKEDNLLLNLKITDCKTFKKFIVAAKLIHNELSFEFYKSGVWLKIVKYDKDEKFILASSSIKFTSSDLYLYRCHLEKIPGYEDDDPSFCFRLTMKSSDAHSFVKSLGAVGNVEMTFNYGDDNVYFYGGKSGKTVIGVTYHTDTIILPVTEELLDDDLQPFMNLESSKLSNICKLLVTGREKSRFAINFDFQYNEDTDERSALIHSVEKKHQANFENYDENAEYSIRFEFNSEDVKEIEALGSLSEKGFVSVYFMDNDTIRFSSHIGNIGMYDFIIFIKKVPK